MIPTISLYNYWIEEFIILDMLRTQNVLRWYNGLLQTFTNIVNAILGAVYYKIRHQRLAKLIDYSLGTLIKLALIFNIFAFLCTVVGIEYDTTHKGDIIDLKTFFFLYLGNLYFACVTMSSVGYGSGAFDPSAAGNHLIFCFMQISGIIAFSFIVGSLNDLIAIFNGKEFDTESDINSDMILMNEVACSCSSHEHINIDKIHDFEELTANADFENELFDSKVYDIIEDTGVGRKVDNFMYPAIYDKYPLLLKCFNYYDSLKFYKAMEFVTYYEGDMILDSKSLSEGIYFINKGTIEVSHHKSIDCPLTYLEEGSYFGEKFILKKQLTDIVEYNFKVVSPLAQILKLPKDVILAAFQRDGLAYQRFNRFTTFRWIKYYELELKIHKNLSTEVKNTMSQMKAIQKKIHNSDAKPEIKQKYNDCLDHDFELNLNSKSNIFKNQHEEKKCVSEIGILALKTNFKSVPKNSKKITMNTLGQTEIIGIDINNSGEDTNNLNHDDAPENTPDSLLEKLDNLLHHLKVKVEIHEKIKKSKIECDLASEAMELFNHIVKFQKDYFEQDGIHVGFEFSCTDEKPKKTA